MICRFCVEAGNEAEMDVIEREIIPHPTDVWLAAAWTLFECSECGATCESTPTFEADPFDCEWTPPPESEQERLITDRGGKR